LDALAHACNPNYMGGKNRRIKVFKASLDIKVSETLSQRTSQ
jgi:hypothetical protein